MPSPRVPSPTYEATTPMIVNQGQRKREIAATFVFVCTGRGAVGRERVGTAFPHLFHVLL